MKARLWATVVAFLFVQTVWCSDGSVDAGTDTETSAAKQYTASDFDAEVKENNHFVKFYAPWCGHCKRLAPTWEELAGEYNYDGSEVVIAKVDCTSDSSVCTSQEVSGYPTLKFFSKGGSDPVKYRGSRDLASLSKFVKEQLGDKSVSEDETVEVPVPVKGLMELTAKTFKKATGSGNHFIKFYAPWCGHCQKLAPVWGELAELLEEEDSVNIAKVDCTTDREICSEFEVKGYPTLLWLQDGEKVAKYQGDRSLDDLKKFIFAMTGTQPAVKKAEHQEKESETETVNVANEEDTGKSLVTVLTSDTFNESINKDYSFVKFYAPWCGHCKRLAPTWDQLAVKMSGNTAVKIAKVDCTDDINRPLCSKHGISGFPTILLYHDGTKVKEYEGNRSLEDMASFLKSNMKASKDEL